MIRRMLLLVGAAGLLLAARPALADWDPGQPHKMHYPQLPDPQGIDVLATFPRILADDWMCSETGFVNDVHIWGSWPFDDPFPSPWVHLSIHANIPADPAIPDDFSRPGDLLWQWDFGPGMYAFRPWGPPGSQTFWDPAEPYDPQPNHSVTWQYNFVDIPDPFFQTRGQIYWLDVMFFGGFGANGEILPLPQGFQLGWKTSGEPLFMDDAVWADFMGPGPFQWRPLFDPRVPPGVPPRSLDLAFVITPEPLSLVLLLAGGAWLLRRRDRSEV